MFFNYDNIKTSRYDKKTISGYNKEYIFKILFKCINEGNKKKSIYFMNEIIASGYIRELWYFFINYTLSYVHLNNMELMKIITLKYKLFIEKERGYKQVKKPLIYFREDRELILNFCYILKNILLSRKTFYLDLFPSSFNPDNNEVTIIPANLNMKRSEVKKIIQYYDENNKYDEEGTKNIISTFFKNVQHFKKIKNQSPNNIFLYLHNIIYKEFQIFDITIDENILNSNFNNNLHINKTKKYIPKLWEFYLKFFSKYDTKNYKNVLILYNMYKNKIGHPKHLLMLPLIFIIYKVSPTVNIQEVSPSETNFYFILYENIKQGLISKGPRIDFIKFYSSKEDKEREMIKNDPILREEETKNIIKNIIKTKKREENIVTRSAKKITPAISPKKPTPIPTPKKKASKKKASKKKEKVLDPKLNDKLEMFDLFINNAYEETSEDIFKIKEIEESADSDENYIKTVEINNK